MMNAKLIFNKSPIWSNAISLLRIWCGTIFIRYGYSILHTDSLYDFAGTLQSANFPFPLLSAYLCKSTEFFGGILLVVGFLIRPICFFLIIDMIAATFFFHHSHILNNGLTTFLLLLCLLKYLFKQSG
jgi:putative oxidoreductase